MRGRRAVLILGLLLIAASYTAQWYSAGGGGTPLALDDYRVKASLEYLASDHSNREFTAEGIVESAWMRSGGHGFSVSLVVRFNDYPWNATVRFSDDGMALESSVVLTGGLSAGLRRMGIALSVLWLAVGHLLPRLFWPKCPDCAGSFWNPVYLDAEEALVYRGGFDDRGDSLPPIKRLDYVCRSCGYRRVTYFRPASPSLGRVFRFPSILAWLPRKQAEICNKMLSQWFIDDPKRNRFHTQAEWRTFYNELKASEREERNGEPNA